MEENKNEDEVCNYCKIKGIFNLSSSLKHMNHSENCRNKNNEKKKSDKIPQENFNCRICNKDFARECELKKHFLSDHEWKEPFECSICNASFVTNPRLKRMFQLFMKEKKNISL